VEREELDWKKYIPIFLVFMFPITMSATWFAVDNYVYENYTYEEWDDLSVEYNRFFEILIPISFFSGLLISLPWVSYRLSYKEVDNPITLEYTIPEESSRLLAVCLMVFIKNLLLFPHAIILWLFGLVSSLLGMIGVITALFGGTHPEFIRDIYWKSSKWNLKVSAWYIGLCDTYPPFDTETEYPIGLEINDLEDDSRSRWLTFYGNILGGKMILLIPQIIILWVYGIVAGLAFFFGPIAVLFTGSYPESFMRVILKTQLQGIRIFSYLFCITEIYPPLSPEEV
tara:strand:- start:81 stop:932 length:852 start_codon:yes stop_codon:yes gene_type:complete